MTSEPFPLTALEELLYWSDRPAWPCLIQWRLRFSGTLQRQALIDATRTALAHHPLLCSRITLKKNQRPRWQISETEECPIEWRVGSLADHFDPPGRIELTREIGLRLRVTVDPDTQRSEILAVLHHACTDAYGIQQFTEDLLTAYAKAGSAQLAETSPVPPRLPSLAARGKFGLNLPRALKLLPGLTIGMLGVRQYLMRDPVPLAHEPPIDPEVPPPEVGLEVVTFTFDRAETDQLLRAARRAEAGKTLNDLFARDLFLTLLAWRDAENVGEPGDWLRLMIPVNLRTADAEDFPAANVASSVFLDRQASQALDPGKLLQGIHEEMALIKRHRLGLIFAFSAWFARLFPGGLARSVRQHRRLGTAVFSNAGRLHERSSLPRDEGRIVAGDVTLSEVAIIAPHFQGVHASYLCSTYAGRLTLTLHYDSRCMTHLRGRELLTGWVDRLRKSMTAA